jgi:serine/threonine protein phosphatase PrpC
MVELRWGAATHPGMIREQNEDDYVAEGHVFAVADGMGGHQAGEIASELAARTIRERLAAGASSVDVVIAAVIEANATIFETAHGNAAQRGMGTTLTAITILDGDGDGDVDPTDVDPPDADPTGIGTPNGVEGPDGLDGVDPAARPDRMGAGPMAGEDRIALVNVGDSRGYLYRDGRLRRITIDHNYVSELVATGHITEAEARIHPRRNIVTRALGIEPNVRVDSWELPLSTGDRFVLCSDGLVDEVEDVDIAAIVGRIDDPQRVAEELVEIANRNGGRDNTTVVVLDIVSARSLAAAAPPPLPDLDDGTTVDSAAVGSDHTPTGTAVTAVGPPPVPSSLSTPEVEVDPVPAATAPPPLPAMATLGDDATDDATDEASEPATGAPLAGIAPMASLTNADGVTTEVCDAFSGVAGPNGTEQIPAATPITPTERRWRVTGKQFAIGLAAAVVVTVLAVLLALALTGGDDEPAPPVTTVEDTDPTDDTTDATDPDTTDDTTDVTEPDSTQRPAPISTRPAVTTTTATGAGSGP